VPTLDSVTKPTVTFECSARSLIWDLVSINCDYARNLAELRRNNASNQNRSSPIHRSIGSRGMQQCHT
jgi:hypothetical protein